MFTGIVQSTFPIVKLDKLSGLTKLTLSLPDKFRENLQLGASIAIEGVCLTVAAIENEFVRFDIIAQTLEVTTLGQFNEGDLVNFERSVRVGDEIGGHHVSGHIDACAQIVAVQRTANNQRVTYQVPAHLMKYILPKGFIALNGCSLTIADVHIENCQFDVCYIPETLKVTTHGIRKEGDWVNIQLERQTQSIVDTVERLMAERYA